jgi:phosphatidylcholine synthase
MQKEFTNKDKGIAWGVHLFTASGGVFALLAIIAIAKHDFVMSMVWLLVAFVVDGVDGMMARRFRVLEVLPQMKGKNIDFVIDFANYAIIPAYFLYEAFWTVDGEMVYLLPEAEWARLGIVALMVLVSAVYYGKEPMVSEDMYFIGFPVLWNAVAYYLFFVILLSPWVNFGVLALFAILHFVPLKYAYPSQNGYLRTLNWLVGLVFLLSNAAILYLYPEAPLWLRVVSGLSLAWQGWQTIHVSLIKK